MSIRIRKNTRIGKGKYISESYSPGQYIFINVINGIIKMIVFIGFKLPYYIIKYSVRIVKNLINNYRNKE